jgi:hypothetical protein
MHRLGCALLALASLGLAGCRNHDHDRPVIVHNDPPADLQRREFTVPAHAIRDTTWVKGARGDLAKQFTGPIARGDWVLLRRPHDVMPAYMDAYYAPQGVVQVKPADFATETFTRVTTRETTWYAAATPILKPGGTIPAGTSVVVIREAGSYQEVYTADGVRGFVLTTDVGPSR